jgi:hypothetical protein
LKPREAASLPEEPDLLQTSDSARIWTTDERFREGCRLQAPAID